MLVDVIPLRSHGQKLPRDQLSNALPIRGTLRVTWGRPGWHRGQRNAPLLAGVIAVGRAEWALPPLDHASVRRIEGPNLLIVGQEELQESRTLVTYRQAWWCRLVEPTDCGGQPQLISEAEGRSMELAEPQA